MISTRVGYAGGTTEGPIYKKIGDHTETLQIEFDPDQISYSKLVEVFWNSHNPVRKPWSKQYMSIAFYHSREQEMILFQSGKTESEQRKSILLTKIRPFQNFYLAEDYHQKYYLQQIREIMQELNKFYPDFKDFVNSTLAARLNGYAAGYGFLPMTEKDMDSMGLLPEDQKRLRQISGLFIKTSF